MSWDEYKKKREETSSWEQYKQKRENKTQETRTSNNVSTTQKKTSLWDNIKNIAGNAGRVIDNLRLGGSSGSKQALNFSLITANERNKTEQQVKNERVLGSKELSNSEKATYIASQNKSNIANTTNLPTINLPTNKSYDKNKVEDIANNSILDKSIQKDQVKIQENIEQQTDAVSKKLAELAPSIGNMAVGAAASAVAPSLGTTYFVTSAGGSYMQDALDRGMSRKEAVKYGKIMGAMEGATEAISVGTLSKAGKGLKTLIRSSGKTIIKKGTEEIAKTSLKTVLKDYGIGIADNIMQEALIEPIQEITAGAIGGQDKANWNDMGQRMLKSGIDGGLTSAILGGANLGIESCIGIVEKTQNGKNVTQQELQTAVKDASKQLDVEKMITDSVQQQVNKYKTSPEQPQSTQNVQKIPSQQVMPMQQENVQNTNIKQNNILPMQNYVYEKSDNVKIDKFRQSASQNFDNSIKTRNYLNMLEKIITDKDIEIIFDTNLKDSQGRVANGSYSNGVITINPNSNRAGEFIAIHELTHAIGTNQMRNIVEQYRKSNTGFNSAVEQLLKNYNTTELTEEAMADVSAQLFGNQEFIDTLAQREPSLFRRIYNEIKYLWHQFTGYSNQNQFIEDLQYKWEQAYRKNNNLNNTTNYSIAGRKALENIKSKSVLYNQATNNYNLAKNMAKQGKKNTEIMAKTGWFKDDTGKLKFSFSDKDMNLKNIKFQENVVYNLKDILEHDTLFMFYPELKNYTVEFKDLNKGKKKGEGRLNGSFSRKYKDIRLDINRANSKFDTEGTLIHEIQHAIQNIEGFTRGTSTKAGKRQYQRSLGEREARDTTNRFINEKYNGVDMSNVLPESATFDRNMLDKMKDALYNYFNKFNEGVSNEEVDKTNQENSKRDRPLVVDRIKDIENSNKGSFSMQDNQGRTLSKEQQEYFKDSKVRDENGNLKIMYHGTDAEFNEFTYENYGKTGTAYGKGFYFTDSKEAGQAYGKILKEVYLDIKKPMEIGKTTMSKAEFKKLVEVVNKETDGIIEADYGSLEDAVMEYDYGGDDIDLTNSLMTVSGLNTERFYEILRNTLGYDGIKANNNSNGKDGNYYLAFNSNQIKNVDNTKPTSNPDIRYSLPTKEWQQYLDENYKPTGTRTNLQDIRLPVKENSKKSSFNLPTNENDSDMIATILEKPAEKVKEKDRSWAIIKANLIDKGMVFEEFSRKTGNRELQGKWDATLTATARGQNAIGNVRYELDPKTKTQKQICKSLTDIIDEVGENTADFYSYMYHQLNIDRMTLEERFNGDTGINYERKNPIMNKPVFGESVTAKMSIQKVAELEKKHPEFKEYAQDVYDYLDANTKELVDNGVISKETQQLFKDMYPHYVPISRVRNKGMAINVPLDTGRTGINSPIKKATGGSSDINPLFETMADRTLQTYRASARNSFGVELKNTIGKTNQVSEQTDIDTIMENMTDEEQNKQLLQEGKNGENPTFTVFENGNKVTYEISKDMYDALKQKNELLSKIDENKASKIANKINNFRRGLLTEYNPVFSITNAIKDAQDILLNSQHSAKTYAKIPEATAQLLSKGYWYNEYIQNGGAQNSYFKDGEFETTKNNLLTKIKNTITFPLRAISNVNNVIEMTPRLAEYIVSREQGRSIETSMLDAARVTTNFKAGGDITKTLNRNGFTFLNASVQGMQQQIRNIQEANAKGLKGYAVLACKYAVAGVPVFLLNNLIWEDDDEYEELQDYVKDNYYIIGKLQNGKFLRIPKGRAVATIQKIVSNANDFVKNDTINSDEVGKVFWEDMKENIQFGIENLAPNNPMENNVLSPIFQAITNKTWYGDDLVPTRLQNKPKEEQYDETTDNFSRWLGEKTGISPIKINYLIDQYSGGAGDVLLPLGTPQAENNVIEDKFTTDATMKSKYPGEFFTKVDELEINKNSSKATDEDILKYKYISSVSTDIGKLYTKKREIQNSSATDKEKKSQLKEVQAQINELAKNSLEAVEKIQNTSTTATIGDKKYYKYHDEWTVLSEEEAKKNKNISLKTYADYKNKVYSQTQAKKARGELDENQSLKNKDKIGILLNSKYSNSEISAIYDNYIKSSSDTEYNIMKAAGIDIKEYLKYKQQEFESDKEDDGTLTGKTVSKSKQKKVVEYLNSMNIKGNQRLLLYAMQGYTTTSNQKTQLANYVNGLKLDKNTKLKLYDKFSGFTVYKDGRVKW